MKYKKPLLAVGAAATIGLAGVTGLGVASAASDTASSTNDAQSSLVDKLATKFNLKKDDVKAVFDQDRSERHAEHQQRVEEKLTQAVKDGKLTEAQKSAILAKLAEMKTSMEANRETMKDKTAAERRALMEQHRSELEAWAKQNNIPTEYLRFVGGPHGGHGHHMGMDDEPSDSGASTESN